MHFLFYKPKYILIFGPEKVKKMSFQFFSQEEGSLELFELLNDRILEECGEYATVLVKVQKTQITYSNPRVFACVSFLRVRRKKEMPHLGHIRPGCPLQGQKDSSRN